MLKFYIHKKDITAGCAVIKGQEAKHLHTVLRCTPGETVELLDGQGKAYLARIETLSRQMATLRILKEFLPSSESPVQIAVAQGMLKDKKMDMVIRHLTELGITRWQPFFSERSIPKPDEKRMENRLERWEKIAREAIKQCGRSRVPEIAPPIRFHGLMTEYQTAHEKIAFWEKSDCPMDSLRQEAEKPVQSIVVLIGPEGGFSESEIAASEAGGFKSYSLGPRILRAETASIAACTLIQHLFGDLGRKNP